jgi:cytochrome c oxidase subunit 2
MSRWKKAWRLLPLLAMMMLALTGCGEPYLSALDPMGPVAQEQLSLMKLSLFIMIGVFIVVMAIFTFVIVRYRRRPGQNEIPEQVEGNHKLEVIWTVIPLILLLILAVPTVTMTFDHAEKHAGEDVIQVNVIAHQFWWEFEYPELGIKTAQDLYIPTGKKIQFALTSKDVIHSFWIPALGGKTDNNPGMVNNMWLEADYPGIYKGKCAELCGASHAYMDFKVVAVEPDKFDTWAANMKQGPAAPATASAQQGQEVFNKSCIACHAVGGQGGPVAPNLTAFGDRTNVAGILEMTDENMANWIKDPQALKPGNEMPAFSGQLDDKQIAALVEYLKTLKVNQ